MANSSPIRVSRTRQSARLAAAFAAALSTAGLTLPQIAKAQSSAPPAPAAQPAPGLMTLISLNKQRLYVYDANGFVAQSRISTGTSGHDTPKGIYSIIQKKKDHSSNLYYGASMPFMQRLLWTGIAMHAGDVPRYPASHGCIRMPWTFAKQHFGMTSLNHRVIITPEVKAPAPVQHPLLFSALPRGDTALLMSGTRVADAKPSNDLDYGRSILERFEPRFGGRTLATVAAERTVERQRLVAANDARQADFAGIKGTDAPPTAALVRARADLQQARASEALAARAADKATGLEKAALREHAELLRRNAERAPRMRAAPYFAMKADEVHRRLRVDRIVAQSADINREAASARYSVEGRARLLAAAERGYMAAKNAISDAAHAAAVSQAALEAFELTERNRPRPLSVLVSSATGRVSLRQGFEPIGEDFVEITGSAKRLGTFVFTATRWKDESQTALDWTVISVDETGERYNKYSTNADAARLPPATDTRRAGAALDRIRFPESILAKIAEEVKPGSTFIISDYDMSRSETSKGTDIIVQMPEVIANTTPAKERRRYASNRRNADLSSPIYTYEDLPYPTSAVRPRKGLRSARRNSTPRREYAVYRPARALRTRPFYRTFSFDYLD